MIKYYKLYAIKQIWQIMLKKNTVLPLKKKIWLATPTPHPLMMDYIKKAYDENWMSTVGENIDEVEKAAARKSGVQYAVGLCNCTAALHLCIKLAAEKLYGKAKLSQGSLKGKRVFCTDMTFAATLNPVIYEGGTPVFIDTDKTTWNMNPRALEKAFALYPDVRLVVAVELYGFPGRMDEIKAICEKHGALLIEDAAEALGANILGKPCGSFGDYGAISFNGNKIITGTSGGCLLTNSKEDAEKARKWSTQSREKAPWYQHEEVGYNYRMSNFIAGAVRGQYPYLEEHIAQKKAVYERYREGLKDLPIRMNPITEETEPNYWLSALTIDRRAMCRQTRTENEATFVPEHGKTCPTEILEALASLHAEGRPIWKPMHLEPLYAGQDFVTERGRLDLKKETGGSEEGFDAGADIFERGCCLPSDNKMTEEEQDRIIEVVKACFD